ncbi:MULTISPECIES: DUF3783 domain-containing protein [Fervidobacterium]|uniref:DUF3783 domain-containing protein n=1 Tax=Fervidobacterium nodosum (strain ATCC 35602 / DSM 5306 / Rt17-B1) TaxID=381764 RepID=A7HKI2_FERNB|nr:MULTISPECIES: DUF3783 domain-containing protein [Fervidobacterium]ABS60415.1 conserved hypothetical protein [Fervidobacterium nodosum Rt17-B1]KAF2960935.1 hypothetical protein AS161_03695 [Fervidobacterium sp. 2310opik-2]PHJ13980.1 hypothetical protein IM41_03370 [Fervidobacterium sp. SC_NGM5_G05]
MEETSQNRKVVLLHNFEKSEILKLMKAVKETFPGEEIIFASTTPTSLEWKVKDLIDELNKEHEEFKKMKQNQQNQK